MVSIGGSPVCGDNTLTANLLPGIYTLVLSDANYLPFAVSQGPPASSLLSDGFADLSGGVFQTCNSSGACLSDINGSFAVDITGIPLVATPEPASLVLLAGVLAVLLPRMLRLTRRAWNSVQATCRLTEGNTVRTVLPSDYRDAMVAMQNERVNVEIRERAPATAL
jgi:hypothetical protein